VSDQRGIDPERGLLRGEAAGMQADPGTTGHDAPAPWAPDRSPPGPGIDPGDPTYYDRPLLKEPVWIWTVPLYFYAGGVSGAAAVLGAVTQLGGRRRALVERCRWLAAVGGAAGSGLLIADLGRPERFLNMLRVIRPRSPMSLGSWALAAAGALTAGSAVLTIPRDPMLRAAGDAAGLGAGLVGLPLSTYTAVLLSTTAVPVWSETRRPLPVLFASSAVSSAASLLELAPLGPEERGVVRRYGIAGKAADLIASTAVEKDAARVERVGRALLEGLSGDLWKAAKALTASSLALSVLSKWSRTARVAAGALGTAGALALRFAIFHAGKASARDPRATFHLQRARMDGQPT
jgi:formate-dependent nitrite reductase membrane component NrfD